jgi:hypothetical protein
MVASRSMALNQSHSITNPPYLVGPALRLLVYNRGKLVQHGLLYRLVLFFL